MKEIMGQKKFKAKVCIEDKPVYVLATNKAEAGQILMVELMRAGVMPSADMLKLEQVEFSEPKTE